MKKLFLLVGLLAISGCIDSMAVRTQDPGNEEVGYYRTPAKNETAAGAPEQEAP